MPTKGENYNRDSHDAVFARIEQKLEDISSDIKDIKKTNFHLEKRVGILENYKYYFTAIVACCTVGVTWLWNEINFK